MLGCTSLLTVAALLAAAALWDLARLSGRIRRVPVSSALDRSGPGDDEVVSGAPQNFLVVGVDGSGGTRDDDVGGPRPVLSDSILVLRTQPATGSVDLLPLPRDLRVDVPGHGRRKINAAMSLGAAEDPEGGGQRLLVETIRQNLDIAINHYVEVDFTGFAAIVDRVGGLSVWFPAPARDRHIGVEVAAAGCVHLDAAQALDLARSRYYDARVDGEWTRDPSSDLGRIRRQQLIIRAVLAEAIDDGARNPLQLRRILYDLAGSVALDDTLAPDDLLALVSAHRNVALEDVVTHDLAVTFADDGDVLLDASPANQALLARFRDVVSVPSAPSEELGPAPARPTPAAAPASPPPDEDPPPDQVPPPDEDPLAPFTPTLTSPDGARCRG